MAAQITATGNLGQNPEPKFTKTGTQYITLNIAATTRQKNKQTNQWEDNGDPLWLKATFWQNDAENITNLNLQKGTKLTIQGTLTQHTYQGQDGQPHTTLEISHPKLLGTIPTTPQHNQPTQQAWVENPPF